MFCHSVSRVKTLIMDKNGLYHQVYRRWYGTPRYKAGLYGPDYENIAGIRNDSDIKRDIDNGLSDSNDMKGLPIEVRVEEGVAILRGSVPDIEHKRLAGEVAWKVCGVVDVVNELLLDAAESQSRL